MHKKIRKARRKMVLLKKEMMLLKKEMMVVKRKRNIKNPKFQARLKFNGLMIHRVSLSLLMIILRLQHMPH